MPLVHQLNDTVYRRRVYLFVGPRQEFREYLLKSYGARIANRVPKHCIGLTLVSNVPHTDIPDTKTVIVHVWLAKWSASPRDWGTLAHECYHAVCAVFTDLGVEMADEEAVTYYLDSMVEQFSRALLAHYTAAPVNISTTPPATA